MQIVIDISDKDYKSITQDYIEYANTTGGRVFKAIKNGTPLPKGHGSLIDGDDMEHLVVCFNEKGMVSRIEAPIVIEADKEREGVNRNIPQEEITYGIMNKNGHVSCLWSKSYAEALDYAKHEQPMNRPYYILERTEHYEIIGEVNDNAPYKTEKEQTE